MEVSNLGVSLPAGTLLCEAAEVALPSSKCCLLLGTCMGKTERDELARISHARAPWQDPKAAFMEPCPCAGAECGLIHVAFIVN